MTKFKTTSFFICLAISITNNSNAEFNFEVGRRAHERLSELIGIPTKIQQLLATYRENNAFPHDFGAPDRDKFMVLGDAILKTFPHDLIYYGLEDGTFVAHRNTPRGALYREPGQSGYDLNDPAVMGEMRKYLDSCVDDDGRDVPCILGPDQTYIECIDDCAVVQKCPDEDSQRECSQLFDSPDDRLSCESKIKWCTSYEIKTTTESNGDNLGYVPRTAYCIDAFGNPAQTPGKNSDLGEDGLGNCYFLNGETLVNRHVEGDYAYCGGDGIICNTTYVGGFQSSTYDPRFRPWYIDTKQKQKSNWVQPYVFFQNQQMGISYSHPIYTSDEEGRSVFAGVLALDFTLEGIASFLTENYSGADTIVAVVEEAEPNYIVATSTGSTGVKRVLVDDVSQPCPEMDEDRAAILCTALRIPVSQMNQNAMDKAVAKSYEAQERNNFPKSELIPARIDDMNAIYASQTTAFAPEDGIRWRIMILSPVESHEDDAIMPGDENFAFLIAPCAIGFIVCSILLFLFMQKRTEKEIIVSDWRFTGVFLLGCALLNLACFSMIGPNTDALCLTRMWVIHFFFVFALAPLFVKTFRLYKLLGVGAIIPKRRAISNARTALMAVPFIAVEVIILLIFTFVDPNKREEMLEYDESSVTHRVVCGHDTRAFFIVQVIYQGGLVFVGCLLAYKTRNMKKEFRDNQQLILTMYNIALVGTIILIVANVVQVYQGTIRIFISIGVFWMTVFSSCVFVLPRLLQIHTRNSASSVTQEGENGQRRRWSNVANISSFGNNRDGNRGSVALSSVGDFEDDRSVGSAVPFVKSIPLKKFITGSDVVASSPIPANVHGPQRLSLSSIPSERIIMSSNMDREGGNEGSTFDESSR